MIKLSGMVAFGLGALLLSSSLLIKATTTNGMAYKTVTRDSVPSNKAPSLSPDHKDAAHIQGNSNAATEAVEDSRDDSSYEVIKAAPVPAPTSSKETPVIETEVIVLGH